MKLPPHIVLRASPGKGLGLYANSRIKAGKSVFVFRGELRPANRASAKALQVDGENMLESTQEFDDYLNHSCAPNCLVRFRRRITLVAARDITAGEELTFHYATTEYDMARERCSFRCRCGAASCLGAVLGFRYLTTEQRISLLPYLSPYLLQVYHTGRQPELAACPVFQPSTLRPALSSAMAV